MINDICKRFSCEKLMPDFEPTDLNYLIGYYLVYLLEDVHENREKSIVMLVDSGGEIPFYFARKGDKCVMYSELDLKKVPDKIKNIIREIERKCSKIILPGNNFSIEFEDLLKTPYYPLEKFLEKMERDSYG